MLRLLFGCIIRVHFRFRTGFYSSASFLVSRSVSQSVSIYIRSIVYLTYGLFIVLLRYLEASKPPG